jgi:hypothetical protein
MKTILFSFFLVCVIGSFNPCLANTTAPEFIKIQPDSTWQKVTISKDQCRSFDIPQLEFSVMIPGDFKVEFHHKEGSAVRLFKMNGDKVETEIVIGTAAFKEKYTIETELIWLDEFKKFPEIKNNTNFSIEVVSGFNILNTLHNYYIMSMKNDLNKFPVEIPMNTISIVHATPDCWFGLAIVVSKYSINKDVPLTNIETQIINTLSFE